LFQFREGSNQEELITIIKIPVIKPKLCDTAVTAKAG
jgi:hypothetical protein